VKLIYIANIRIPTEKAHGLQIMQNCEAFADAGADLTLWIANRFNSREFRAVRDAWAYYGVKRNFTLRRLPCLDLIPLVPNRTDIFAKAAFYLQLWTFTLAVVVLALFNRADVYYSRDAVPLLLLSLFRPRQSLAYEAHRLAGAGGGRWLQTRVVRRVGTVIAITAGLAEDLKSLGADPSRTMVAHDGIRAARFEGVPSKEEARTQLGWPQDAYIVGYVGQLQTMAIDKGVSSIVDALRQVEGASIALVGGPDDIAEELRARWLRFGLPEENFLYAGQVKPTAVPLYLSAFDVCAMPHPQKLHFARHTSPLKLFEYMASQRPVVASNLPGFMEVVRDGTSALLVPPGDTRALAEALTRLRDNPGLRDFLADAAYKRVMSRYTWAERARQILDKVRSRPERKQP
jgi:glycosyltransferase involved in cell wall biosynthesis